MEERGKGKQPDHPRGKLGDYEMLHLTAAPPSFPGPAKCGRQQ